MKLHKLHDNSLSLKQKSFQMLFEREQRHGLIMKFWRQTVPSRGTRDNEPFVPENNLFLLSIIERQWLRFTWSAGYQDWEKKYIELKLKNVEGWEKSGKILLIWISRIGCLWVFKMAIIHVHIVNGILNDLKIH